MDATTRRLRTPILVIAALVAFMLLAIASTTFGQPAATGSIAYARDGALRLVEVDGRDDRLLWEAPGGADNDILGLDWRPDGGALAFAADFESDCSYYASDLYTVLADGAGLRRATNSPLCSQMADFPTGSVTLQITNQVPEFSLFSVYIQGAQAPTAVTIPVGATRTITIRKIANLGDMEQAIVVVRGDTRWIDPDVTVNIVTAANAQPDKPLVLRPQENAFRAFGVSSPAWASDASRIGFVRLLAELRQISAYPAVAEADSALTMPPDLLTGDTLAWSPISDEILVTTVDGIYLIEAGATELAEPLVAADGQSFLGLDWLPDASGFVYAQTGGESPTTHSNLFVYTFDTATSEPLTTLTSGFVSQPAVSGDGQLVAFERAPNLASAAELWLIDRDGDNLEPLGVVGRFPDWRPQRTASFFAFFFMPLVGDNFLGITPTFTPTPTDTPTPTATATPTLPPTLTPSPEPTSSGTPEATATGTVSPTPHATADATATAGPTSEPTATATPVETATAAATATTAPTATATVPPLDVVDNGDFEAGPNGDWSESINGVELPGSFIVKSEPILPPRSGDYVAWLGGFDNQVHRLTQSVQLPNTTPLLLAFWIQIRSNESGCSADSVIVSLGGDEVETIALCSSAVTPGWQPVVIDAGSYAGQQVELQFTGSFDETVLSSLFVDDVVFQGSP